MLPRSRWTRYTGSGWDSWCSPFHLRFFHFSISLLAERPSSSTLACTRIKAMIAISEGFIGSSSFQPTHGRIGSVGPDHEVIDGTWNWSEDGPENAEDNYPSCPAASLSLVMGWLPIRTWFVHGPAPPLDLDKVYPSGITLLYP